MSRLSRYATTRSAHRACCGRLAVDDLSCRLQGGRPRPRSSSSVRKLSPAHVHLFWSLGMYGHDCSRAAVYRVMPFCSCYRCVDLSPGRVNIRPVKCLPFAPGSLGGAAWPVGVGDQFRMRPGEGACGGEVAAQLVFQPGRGVPEETAGVAAQGGVLDRGVVGRLRVGVEDDAERLNCNIS